MGWTRFISSHQRAGIHRSVAREKPLPTERKNQTHFLYAKKDVGDFENIWKNALWSDGNEIELFSHQGKPYILHITSYHSENTLPHIDV